MKELDKICIFRADSVPELFNMIRAAVNARPGYKVEKAIYQRRNNVHKVELKFEEVKDGNKI